MSHKNRPRIEIYVSTLMSCWRTCRGRGLEMYGLFSAAEPPASTAGLSAPSPSRETRFSNSQWHNRCNCSCGCVTGIAGMPHTNTHGAEPVCQPLRATCSSCTVHTRTHCNESFSRAFASRKHHAGTRPEANKAGGVSEQVGQAAETWCTST